MATALGLTVDHFFVGKDRTQRRTPVYRHLFLIGQPALIQLQKDKLRPAIVRGVAGRKLTRPVVAKAQHLELPTKVVDGFLGRDLGMDAGLQRILLGRKTEGVPAHRVKDIKAARSFVAADDIGGGVALGMTYVKARARRVGKHIKRVVLGLVATCRRDKNTALGPEGLPLGFNLLRSICHGQSVLPEIPPA